MIRNISYSGLSLLTVTAAFFCAVAPAGAQDTPTPGSGAGGKKPNILFIMFIADLDAPRHGIIRVRPQNLDSLAESLRADRAK